MRTLLVCGAKSKIIERVLRKAASEGWGLVLAGRGQDQLNEIAADLRARGANSVDILEINFSSLKEYETVFDRALELNPKIDSLVLAQGVLPEQSACEDCFELYQEQFEINASSSICVALKAFSHFESNKIAGVIAGISSVAGVRGRMSNYCYGAAKAALSTFLGGLANRGQHTGIRVYDIRPGFVDSPMTAAIKKNFLFSQPAAIGERIFALINKGSGFKNSVIYLPWYWRLIMRVIKELPDPIFNRLKL